MSDQTKTILISALNTFIATLVATIGATLVSGDIQWTGAFWLSVVIAGVRAGIKAITDKFVPISLGGKK